MNNSSEDKYFFFILQRLQDSSTKSILYYYHTMNHINHKPFGITCLTCELNHMYKHLIEHFD